MQQVQQISFNTEDCSISSEGPDSILQNLERETILFERTYMSLAMDVLQSFQKWGTNIIKTPDNWDLIEDWQFDLESWEVTFNALLFPFEVYKESGLNPETLKSYEDRMLVLKKRIQGLLHDGHKQLEVFINFAVTELLRAVPTTLAEELNEISDMIKNNQIPLSPLYFN